MRINLNISLKDLLSHLLATARSGGGKSVFLMSLTHALVQQSNGNRKHSVLLIDPHGDLARSCMAFTIQDKSRLIYLSTAINQEAKTEREHTFVFNPCSYDGSAEMRYLLTETLTDCLCELLADATLTVQMLTVVKPCIATILRIDDPAQRNLATLARFFRENDNKDLIELGLTSEVEQHRIFFQNWHADHLKVSKNSLNVKLSFFLSDQRLANILNGVPTFDLSQAIENGSVIVAAFPKGSGAFTSKVLGKLLFASIHALMMRRDGIAEEKRKPLYVIADEFTSILTASVGASLAEARKYKMACILACQSLSQISDTALKHTINVNTGTKVAGLTSYQDRVFMGRELGVDATDIENLRPLEFYLKRNDGRAKPIKFKASILPSAYFISSKKRSELLQWLVYESGQYAPIPPPPPPSPAIIEIQSKPKKGISKSTGNGLKPAF